MTGHGSSVGPGIIRVARVCGTPQRMLGSMLRLLECSGSGLGQSPFPAPDQIEKNQNETGITLSFLRSDAIHCTRKRMEKNACPKKPTDSQRCSALIMVNPSR